MSRSATEIAELVQGAFRRAGLRPPFRCLPRWHILALLHGVDRDVYGLVASLPVEEQRAALSELRACDLLAAALPRVLDPEEDLP